MNEFELIDSLLKNLNFNRKEVIVKPGDDTSVIKLNNDFLFFTTDSLVEDVHFSFNWNIDKKVLFQSIGWKSIAVNVSDIYAMGGVPLTALVSLFIPHKFNYIGFLDILYEGMNRACKRYNLEISGGNISRTYDKFIVSVAMLGIKGRGIFTRNSAKENEYIYVQKYIGDSSAGLFLLKENKKEIPERFINSLLFPEPEPVPEGINVNSAIDISDGFIGDLMHILKQSGKGAEIYIEKIPASEELKEYFPDTYKDFVLYGGEDYKIIFTSQDLIDTPNTVRIGVITPHKTEILLVDKSIKIKIKQTQGFTHF